MSTNMPVTVRCPRLHCRAVLRLPEDVRGKRVRCGQCGMTFIVPDNAPLGPAPAPPAEKEQTPARRK